VIEDVAVGVKVDEQWHQWVAGARWRSRGYGLRVVAVERLRAWWPPIAGIATALCRASASGPDLERCVVRMVVTSLLPSSIWQRGFRSTPNCGAG
jgi:hypothetical protein